MQTLIEKHERAIRCIEGINHFAKRQIDILESMQSDAARMLPAYNRSLRHDFEIAQKCEMRLTNYYVKNFKFCK